MRISYLPCLSLVSWQLGLCGGYLAFRPAVSQRTDVLSGDVLLALEAVIRDTSGPDCSLILFSDGLQSSYSMAEGARRLKAPWGYGIFDISPKSFSNSSNDSNGDAHLDQLQLLSEARKFRRKSWCLTTALISNSLEFLKEFADASLKRRFLVWSARLIVVTSLPQEELSVLIASYWTYSMLNSMALACETPKGDVRCGIFTHLPYAGSRSHFVQIAKWSRGSGIVFANELMQFFPNKFSNFQGHQMNVTALTFAPHWIVKEEIVPGGGTRQIFSGTDYFLLKSIASALNFTIYIVPTANWVEVTKKVEERESFIASVIYGVLPNRLLLYDYTYAFEFASPTFCMKKPALEPQWQSLYRPLTDTVWLSTLAALILVPVAFYFLGNVVLDSPEEQLLGGKKKLPFGVVVQDLLRILLAQDMHRSRGLSGASSRILVGSWLVFSFILGVAYRGNLTASLTLPKYPPRAETLEELITVVDRVTMPPYGDEFRTFYRKSDSVVFQSIARMWETVSSGQQGILEATKMRQAHIDVRRYLELIIARQFTSSDGSTNLYLGKGNLFPGLSAWPIPHDAPYKGALDRAIMAVKEAGLYEKWSSDIMQEVRKESRESKLRETIARSASGNGVKTDVEENSENVSAGESKAKPLTVIHMQGPLMLLVLGLAVGLVIFSVEMSLSKCYRFDATYKR